MRILHVASFQGNLGDKANHLAFRHWFSGLVGGDVFWSELEIRSVLRREVDFRKSLTRASAEADLVVIGGGGFWELWPEDFWSGTSLDLDLEFLESLDKPILFNALGVDDGRGVGRSAEQNFGRLYSFLQATPSLLVSVRNDGSSDALGQHFGFTGKDILEVPDHGFFAGQYAADEGRPVDGDYVAISLAQDMPEIRFRGGYGVDTFIADIVYAMEELVRKFGISFVLVPHIYSDLEIYSGVLRSLSDKVRREKTVVASLETTSSTALNNVNVYRHASLTWAMRFHASAISIGAGTPTIGLLSYPKVRHIFRNSGGFEGSGIEVSTGGFGETLLDQSGGYLDITASKNRAQDLSAPSQYMDGLSVARARYGNYVSQWLKTQKLRG